MFVDITFLRNRESDQPETQTESKDLVEANSKQEKATPKDNGEKNDAKSSITAESLPTLFFRRFKENKEQQEDKT